MSGSGFNTAEVRRVDDFASDQALQDFGQYRLDVLETIGVLDLPRTGELGERTVFGSSSLSIWHMDGRNPLPSPDRRSDVDLIIADDETIDRLRTTYGWDSYDPFRDGQTVRFEIGDRPGLPLPVDVIWSTNPDRLRNMAGYDSDLPPNYSHKLGLTVVDYLLTGSKKAKSISTKGPASVIREQVVAHHTEDELLTDEPTWHHIVGIAMTRLIAGVPEKRGWFSRGQRPGYPSWLGDLVAGGFSTHPAFRDIEPVTLKKK